MSNLTQNELLFLKVRNIDPDFVEFVNIEDQQITFKDGTTKQCCEVYTRVMGYHRPVTDFNRGKQAEHSDRVYFKNKT